MTIKQKQILSNYPLQAWKGDVAARLASPWNPMNKSPLLVDWSAMEWLGYSS